MDPKVFLAIALLLHTPIVLGCVNFNAQLLSNGYLAITLVDNGVSECSYYGGPNSGSSYQLNCVGGYAALLNTGANGGQGQVMYNPPSGNYVFDTTLAYSGSGVSYYANWGC